MEADVVKAHQDDEEEDAVNLSTSVVFTEEQQKYVHELDRKAASLKRSIQELRLRLPPPDIFQRLPHLHAHSVAYNAALTRQINSQSLSLLHTQLREVTLREENVAYGKAISSCENKIPEKIQEADSLLRKLKRKKMLTNSFTA